MLVLAATLTSCTLAAAEPVAVLREDNPSDPQQGKRYEGSVTWRTESSSGGGGRAPELVVRADIEIPERQMSVKWSLRRNTDKRLPATHTIDIMFKLPPNPPNGVVAKVPGIVMKPREETHGMPLSGASVEVTSEYFMLGLSAVNADAQRNLQLLKEWEWLDILFAYANGGRSVLSVRKGESGDRAFADAFAAWNQ